MCALGAASLEADVYDGQRWGLVGVAVFVVAGFLLLSMGGAIVAAPVTVPLMYLAVARHPTPAFRRLAVVLSALTVAEVAWALTYFGNGEAQPWIWLVPGLAGAGAAAALSTALRRRTVATSSTA